MWNVCRMSKAPAKHWRPAQQGGASSTNAWGAGSSSSSAAAERPSDICDLAVQDARQFALRLRALEQAVQQAGPQWQEQRRSISVLTDITLQELRRRANVARWLATERARLEEVQAAVAERRATAEAVAQAAAEGAAAREALRQQRHRELVYAQHAAQQSARQKEAEARQLEVAAACERSREASPSPEARFEAVEPTVVAPPVETPPQPSERLLELLARKEGLQVEREKVERAIAVLRVQLTEVSAAGQERLDHLTAKASELELVCQDLEKQCKPAALAEELAAERESRLLAARQQRAEAKAANDTLLAELAALRATRDAAKATLQEMALVEGQALQRIQRAEMEKGDSEAQRTALQQEIETITTGVEDQRRQAKTSEDQIRTLEAKAQEVQDLKIQAERRREAMLGSRARTKEVILIMEWRLQALARLSRGETSASRFR